MVSLIFRLAWWITLRKKRSTGGANLYLMVDWKVETTDWRGGQRMPSEPQQIMASNGLVNG
jgi:hypothetical protein